MRTSILISALVLLLAANFLMMYVTPFGMTNLEGFKKDSRDSRDTSGNGMRGFQDMDLKQGFEKHADTKEKEKTPFENMKKKETEGFSTYTLANGGGAGDSYQVMGAFDGIRLKTGNSSSWRSTSPNEPLTGPEFKPGDDSLFIFKNNQCKPECCGASFSCDGGCVCTTPQQRDYINQRGGNRTLPDDSV
jgi:hypothetical protein